MALPGIRRIELAGLKAWPGLEVEHDGSWVRRAAGGYTKRANSVQCLDPDDDGDTLARIAASRRWFEARRLPAIFRITPLAGPRLLLALREAGWQSFDHSRTLAMELDGSNLTADPRAELLPPDDPRFLLAQRQLWGYDATTIEKLSAIVSAIDLPIRGVVVCSAEGRPVASALMDVVDGIVFAGNVVTAVADRGKGYATAAMRSGLAWAISEGARAAALNVLAGNAPALTLYRSLGYAHIYDYDYREPSSQ